VKDPLSNEHTIHRLIVPVRSEDVPIVVRPSKKKAGEVRKFRKEMSVFRDWKEDNDATYEKLS
jgi:hypothetical protein